MDNRVRDRVGQRWRGPWRGDRGRGHEVGRGPDVRGMVFPIHPMVCPLPRRCWPQQGRYKTKKAALCIGRFSRRQAAWSREGMARTKRPLPLAAGWVSPPRRDRLWPGGFPTILRAGHSHDTWTRDGQKQEAAHGQNDVVRRHPTWGMAVPSCRVHGPRPTCGARGRFFVQQSPPRRSSVMPLSPVGLRGAESWHIGQPQPLIECCWKIRTSIFPLRSRQ